MHLRQAGLSLIELMIAITLGLILMAGVVQVFLSSKTVFSTQQAMSRIQETGRLAVDFMARDIRMAAYYGCYRPKFDEPGAELQDGNIVIKDLHGNFAEGVRGYKSIDSLPGKAADLGASITPLKDKTANVLVLHTANGSGLPLSKANDSKGIYAYSPDAIDSKGCVAGICKDSAAVVSDCFKARVFKLVAAPSLVGTDIYFKHDKGWGGGIVPTENFTTGEVLAMNTVVYFLAEGPTGTPSLWQKTNAETALELLEGVEHMRVTYHVVRDANGDGVNDNDEYRLADALNNTEWPFVQSVRIELVVRSADNNVVEKSQPYTFAGATVTPDKDDRYLRQVFSSTIGIRSRATNIQ
ncbi:PilW family protein [Cellvibrio sp. OA-2007]|uniref:PilW family protein n=1 Tax=Cellvibrio sp. OA-2007 TaxID=529823 RepID=UPI00078174CA|nr:PilW family protein [Cellvibrio sp. OA-2007]